MGLLAESATMADWVDYGWGIAQGILGLGFVIFVHELGHFAVAKMCGVKCEKFYLGFDIGGLKLAKVQWGETEYGIGILPLGGYVKMLGQDDNPARAEEERRRSSISAKPVEDGPAQVLPGLAHSPTPPDAVLDPRSYMAKSVPQRMAIISAGVIMNVIFAFLMAALAFYIGVPEHPCAISALMPGGAGWRAGLQPGDRIIQINDRVGTKDRPLRFNDLREAVTLSDPEKGVTFIVERPGEAKPIEVTIKPDAAKAKVSLAPTIGADAQRIPQLTKREPVWPPTAPAAVSGEFKGLDRIVAIDGNAIDSFDQVQAAFAQHAEQTLNLSIKRENPETLKEGQLEIKLPPRPRRWLGLVMGLGKVAAVQDGSPAHKAGLLVDDFIVSIDGQAPGEVNVMALPELFRSKVGESMKLEVTRKTASGEESKVELTVTPRDPGWFEGSSLVIPESPLTIPALGLAVKVVNVIQAAEPDSPAAAAVVKLTKDSTPAPIDRISPRDEITKIELIPADDEKKEKEEEFGPLKIEFVDGEGNALSNWPFFMSRLQRCFPDTKVKVSLRGDRFVEIQPADSPTEFNPDRGLSFKYEEFTFKATTLGEAFSLAATETKRALLQVYSFLKRLGTRISPFALGGPLTIFGAAGGAAERGFSSLLLFLTMLSANLAVINFLPIPVLDGGHMVFLALEGICRRPVSERVVLAFQYAGLIFILTLMLFVIGLDIGLIPRF